MLVLETCVFGRAVTKTRQQCRHQAPEGNKNHCNGAERKYEQAEFGRFRLSVREKGESRSSNPVNSARISHKHKKKRLCKQQYHSQMSKWNDVDLFTNFLEVDCVCVSCCSFSAGGK